MKKGTLMRHLFERQTGLGAAKYEASQESMLRSVCNLRPVQQMQHQHQPPQPQQCVPSSPTKETSERNHIARLRFNKPGYLIGTSYWSHDCIELWDWQLQRPRTEKLNVHTLMGCSVVRFDWLYSHREAHILAVGKYGDVKLIDIHHHMCYELLTKQPCASMAYALHHQMPFNVLYATRDGRVRNFDIRKEPVAADNLLMARNQDGSPYEIYSLKVNPVNCNEFAVAGCSEDIRLYDRRKPGAEPFHTMFMTTYPGLRTNRPGRMDPTGEYSYMTNERRKRRWSLQEMSYNYNGSQLAVSCGYDAIYQFDTSMRYPLGSFGSNCLQTSDEDESVSYSITGSVVYGLEYFGQHSDFLVAMARGHEHTYDKAQAAAEFPSSRKRTSLYVWNTYNQKLVRRIPMDERNWNFAVHPNQPLIATALDQKGIQLWSTI